MAGIEDVQRAINAHMAAEGYTRAQFARRVGIDPGTLGDLLDGKRQPKAPTQGKLERYFEWPAGTIAEVVAGRASLGDVGASSQDAPGVMLDLGDAVAGLSPLDAEEVLAAAKLRALERAREIRRSLEG